MLRPEPLDFIIIALIAMLLFGANRLPETARGIKTGLREFKAAITGQEEEQPRLASANPVTQAAAVCRNCKQPLEPGAKFCTECGATQVP